MLVGVQYQWPAFSATMDFFNPLKSSSKGFSPITTHTFNASGDIIVATSVGLPIGLGLGVDLLKGLWDKQVAIVDRPAIEIVAEYSLALFGSSTSGGGAPSGSFTSATVNGGACNGIAWYIDLVNTLQLAAGDHKYSLGQWNSPALAQGCLGGVPATNCSNSGMQWAYFNSFNGLDPGLNPLAFDANQFNSLTPLISGTTTSIGGFSVPGSSLYNFYNSPIAERDVNLAMMHVGYIFAKQSGIYTFQMTQADDLAFIWCGPLAYAGFSSANALLTASFHNAPTTTTLYMSEGTYYPLRVLWAQASGPGTFAMSITAPDGTTIFDSSSPANPYIVQRSCDGTSAPAYPTYVPSNTSNAMVACGAQGAGLNYYAYTNSYNFNLADPGWNVAAFAGTDYFSSGTVTNVNVISTSSSNRCYLPGQSTSIDCSQLTLVMKGYLYAATTGSYTIASDNSVDNFLGMWANGDASNYNNNNAGFISTREGNGPFDNDGASQTYTLTAGTLMPITIIYMNGGGAGNYNLAITTPDGVTHTDTTSFFYPTCTLG